MRLKSIHVLFLALIILSFAGSVTAQRGRGERAQFSILWKSADIGETLESSPAINAFNNVYVATSKGTFSFNAQGALRWSQLGVKSLDGTMVSLSPDNQFAFVAESGIQKIDTADGRLVWSKVFGEETFGTVVATSPDGTRLYVGAGDGFNNLSDNFYALNASDGSIAWAYVERDPPQQEGGGDIRGHLGGAVVDGDGTIYVSNQHGYLVSLTDNGNGFTENWKFSLKAEARMPASISSGFIFQSSNLGLVHKIDKLTGVEVTTGNYPALGNIGEVFAPIVFSNDGATFYVNAEDRNLYVDTEMGSVKWSFEFEEWGSNPLIRADGIILVMCQSDNAGRVCAIQDNGNSASLIWTSDRIVDRLPLNETNLNLAGDGTIYVHAGDQSPLVLYALMGNGVGLSQSSPWPKLMGGIRNNGNRRTTTSN